MSELLDSIYNQAKQATEELCEKAKALNKEALTNARMKNESLRFEIDNRKQEIARWNQVRSNVNKHFQNTSQIKTSY